MSRILPILFNTDMVKAILDDRKHATRRPIKGYIPDDVIWEYTVFTPEGRISCREIRGQFHIIERFHRLPCQPRDILYVRETWYNANKEGAEPDYYYYADTFICEDYDRTEWKWHPSIHMPKDAARIWLKVTDVKVERLNAMTLDDFLDEGVTLCPEAFNDPESAYQQARAQFKGIWDATLKPAERDKYGWEANPWVWVIEFERCEKPEVAE